MEILEPSASLPGWLSSAVPQAISDQVNAIGRPADSVQAAAEFTGRVNAIYDGVWMAVRSAPDGHWVPVRCNNMRRALLLASAAIQHRTLDLEVWRRGRVVCIRRRATTVGDSDKQHYVA